MSQLNTSLELRVPYGLDAGGRFASPNDSFDGELACPACGSGLTVRGGPYTQVQRHFEHRADVPCSQDAILHKAAKGVVAQVLREALAKSEPLIHVHRQCCRAECGKEWTAPFQPKADEVRLDHRLAGGRVVDVGVLSGERVRAVVEVRSGGAGDEGKADREKGVPTAVLDADEVLRDPYRWRPAAERARPLACPSCRGVEAPASAEDKRWGEIRRIAKKTGQMVPSDRDSPYWVEPYECWKDTCAQEMLVYSWKGHTWMTDHPPPEPRPESLKHRYSKQARGKYWVNVCPSCDRIQGENSVYEPTGPLPRRLAGRR